MTNLENTVETEKSGSLPVLVFVHLSTVVPRYVWANIKRTAQIFPSLRVVLISDLEENLVRAKALGIIASAYKADQELFDLLANRTLNPEFRKGFWKTSILRLFAYLEFAEANGTPAIHIESDILLMRDFPWHKLAALEKLAWLQFNDDRDVAALITCPNEIEAKWLNKTLREEIKLSITCTDMTLLRDISRKSGDKVYLLPIAPKGDSKLFQLDSTNEARAANSRLYSELGGIFDGAALGMWLYGQDARNNFGLLKRHANLFDSYIDTSNIELVYNRGSLFYVENNQNYKIFNLHLHSKIEMDFGKLWLIRLILNSKLASIRCELITFAPRKFVEFVQGYTDRQGPDPIKLVKLIIRKLRSKI
jgi:hypothetical protein